MSDTIPSSGPRNEPWWVKPGIAVTNKLLFAIVLVAAMVVNLHDILMIMAGAVINMAMNPDTYYFGSSSGSARKSELLASSVPIEPK